MKRNIWLKKTTTPEKGWCLKCQSQISVFVDPKKELCEQCVYEDNMLVIEDKLNTEFTGELLRTTRVLTGRHTMISG